MDTGSGPLLLHHIRRLADAAGEPDGELLRRFCGGDEQAFAALLRRHGPMVWAACRRVLVRLQDAEDVFQSTFLLLARKAGALERRGSVGGWLHGAACRLALRRRADDARRRVREARATGREAADPLAEVSVREAQQIFDDALARLPERPRSALVLCHLEGLTQEEAARQIGCSLSTLKRALEEGRERLRLQLARRGLTLPAALLAAAVTAEARALPPALVEATLKAATSGVELLAGRLRAAVLALVLLVAVTGGIGAALRPVAHAPGSDAAEPAKPASRVDAFGDPLPEGAVRRLGTLRFRPGSGTIRLLISRNGKHLITKQVYGPALVQVWDLATGKLLHRLASRPDVSGGLEMSPFQRAVDLSPDGKTIALGRQDHVRLYDLASGREVRRLNSPLHGGHSLAFSPDGKHLAVGQNDKHIQLWDLSTNTVVGQFATRHGAAQCLTFSPDGKLLASGGGVSFYLFDVGTRKLRYELSVRGEVDAFAFSPDSSMLAVGGESRPITIWDPVRGKKLGEVPNPTFQRRAIAWSPDGKALVASQYDQKALSDFYHFYDPATGKEHRRIKGFLELTECLAFTPDGKTLVTAGGGRVIRRWDVATGAEQAAADGVQQGVWWTALSPDGKTLAYHDQECIRLWDMVAAREVGRLPGQHASGLFTRDGKQLVCGDLITPAFHVWDLATRSRVGRIDSDEKKEKLNWPSTGKMALSPDGKTLATAAHGVGPDGTTSSCVAAIRLWDRATGKEVRRLPIPALAGTAHTASSVVYSPDGRTLATSEMADKKAGRVRLWDAATGRELSAVGAVIEDSLRPLQNLPIHQMMYLILPRVVFSPDGRLLAMNNVSNHILVWEAATGRLRGRLEGGPSTCVCFSGDGRTLASADYGGGIRLWDVTEGKEIRRLPGHRDRIQSLTFTPDSKTLISASEDTTLLFWDVAAVTRRTTPTRRIPAKEWDALWADLAGDDGVKAHRAIARLGADPEGASAIRARVRPAVAPDATHLANLLRGLDADTFDVRKKSSAELRQLGELALPSLERERTRPDLSPESRRRLDELLEHAFAPPTGEALRALRAAEVLERIGTPEARGVLETIAKGAAESRLTREAMAALRRLAKGS